MKRRVLQVVSWINVASGALMIGGTLFAAYAALLSREAERPFRWEWVFLLITLCMGLGFLLAGHAFLTRKTAKAAESSASGFAILLWLISGPLFSKSISAEVPMPLGTILGILFACVSFFAIKRFVIKPCFPARPAS